MTFLLDCSRACTGAYPGMLALVGCRDLGYVLCVLLEYGTVGC